MTIHEFISEQIKEINNGTPVENDEADLLGSEILDSLGIVTLLSNVEENYQIEIDPDDIIPDHFENIAAIVSLIEKYTDK